MAIDLVCWDFGDTLVDEGFMRIPPEGVPGWAAAYNEVFAAHPAWVDAWDLGRGSINDLVGPLAERLPMTPNEIARHLRAVWDRITWFPDSDAWVDRLDGRVAQAVVTVNPHEFTGIARACGLDARIPVIVTSAEVGSISKVALAERAREILGLSPGVTTTVLVDNLQLNVDEFAAAGGAAIVYEPESGCLDALGSLVDL